MNKELKNYLDKKILPKYNNPIIDSGHRQEHIDSVIERSMKMADDLKLSESEKEIVYTAAIMHDIGLLKNDRENHNKLSADMVKKDKFLSSYFSVDDLNKIADAVEDHRASLKYEPRSIYGKIISTADRSLDIDTILRRSIQYRLDRGLTDYEDLYRETYKHFIEKFSRNGYMKVPLKTKSIEKMLDEIYKYEDER